MTYSKMRDGLVQRGRTWSYVVREQDQRTGQTKPRWVGGYPTRTAAKSARDQARHAVNRGTYVPPQNLTVGEYLDRWIDAHSVSLKPSTTESYRANIDRYLRPTVGREPLQSLSPSRLSIIFKQLYERGGRDGRPLSPRTVEFARAVLRRAMQDALLDRLIEVNPVIGTKRPRVVKPEHCSWTGPQLQTYLTHVRHSRWAPLWVLAAATGMRRGELVALRWKDVDLDAGIVSVERSVTYQGRERTIATPKNHERRDVSVDPRTLNALRTWKTQQAQEKLAWGQAYRDAEGLLFTWEDGSPVLPDYASKAFQSSQQDAGLPRLTLHQLRHSHATILLRAGVPVHVVAKRLGHKDPSVTLNVYAHAIPDDDGRALEVYTRAVFG